MKYTYQEISHFKRGEYDQVNHQFAVYKNITYLRYLWLKLRGYFCIKILNEKKMILKEFIEQFIEKNTLIRLQYKIKGGHEEVTPNSIPIMEWELKESEYSNRKVIGITDILYKNKHHSEAVNLTIERE